MNTKLAEKRVKGLLKNHDLGFVCFKWTAATKAFGRAEYLQQTLTPFRLKLSKPFTRLNSWRQVKETVLHEIAHLQTIGHQHDEIWQQQFIKIGGLGCVHWDDDKRIKALGQVKRPIRK